MEGTLVGEDEVEGDKEGVTLGIRVGVSVREEGSGVGRELGEKLGEIDGKAEGRTEGEDEGDIVSFEKIRLGLKIGESDGFAVISVGAAVGVKVLVFPELPAVDPGSICWQVAFVVLPKIRHFFDESISNRISCCGQIVSLQKVQGRR